MKNRFGQGKLKQHGVTVPMLALFIVVLFAMASLAIDLGVLYTARTSAQHAADAGALAGAYTFVNSRAEQPLEATTAAIVVAGQNKILGQAVTITAADVTVDVPNYQVTVRVPRTGANGIETFFAKVIGFTSIDVEVKATAQAAKQATSTRCLKPLYVANTVLADPAEKPDDACKFKHVVFDTATHDLTDLTKSLLDACAGPTPGPGCVPHLLRPTDPKNAASPSQYYSVDFGTGGSTYRCSLGHCLTDPDCNVDNKIIDDFGNPSVKCGDTLATQNGNDIGNTIKGFDDLLGSPPPTFNYIGSYNNGGSTSDSSNSIITAPVWDNCKFPIKPGKQDFPIIGFITMFVNKPDADGNFNAYLVSAGSCGANPPGPGGGSGSFGLPVRLIQTPAQ